MQAACLREEPFDGYNWNVGDQLIHGGVAAVLEQLGVTAITWFNRKHFTPPELGAEFDVLAYAGMPQFAATDRPTSDDLAWAALRRQLPPPIPALNIGCGTGYSLQCNRLQIAANMAGERYNRFQFSDQHDVIFAARDALTWHFLDLMGMEPTLSLCPSGFAPLAPVHRTNEIGLSLVHPDIKFDATQKCDLNFDFSALIRALLAARPDAIVLCQEPIDVAYAKSLGATRIELPEDLAAFTTACGKLRAIVSTRVHASVLSLRQGVTVLHWAIDGRSDLLTPYMAAGLRKVSLFNRAIQELVDEALAVWQKPPPPIVADSVVGPACVSLRASLVSNMQHGKPRLHPRQAGAVVVNPSHIVQVRSGDSILFLADRFHVNDATKTTHSIVASVRAAGRHCIFGPYVRLPSGKYEVIFDFEFWGNCTNDIAAFIIVDISDGQSAPLVRRRMLVTELLTAHGVISMHFLHTREKADLEFRVEFEGEAPNLRATFHGVRLRVLAAY